MAAQGSRHWEQDKEATVYVGNLDERVTDELVWEMMLQVGRVQGVHLPKDRVTQLHQGFGFVEFTSEEDADYAAKIMNQVKLWGKAIRVNKASADKQKSLDVGAELFIGNLDPMVDEQYLFEVFSRFGTLVKFPSIAKDETGLSKGFGFISFTDFEAADLAISNMHGGTLSNKEVTVAYALKKDGSGARHGDQAERELARAGKAQGITVNVEPINLGIVNAPAPAPVQQNGFYQPQYGQQPNGYAQRPLQPPPNTAGVPARPPPSAVGYGGPPQSYGGPPGYGANPYGAPPGAYGAPPPGMPPGMPPGGYGGPPPGMPPNGYGGPPPGGPPGYPPRR